LSRAPLRFHAARGVLRLLLGAVLRVRVEGRERLPAGPHVLACNHLSWVDPFLLIAWLPASPRVHFLGRRSAIHNRRWKRWVLRFMGGVIPVESGEIRHVSEAVGEVLARGGVVAIFPEGRVGAEEGAL
jgi:1-acyl-sn-glycerol-3-phosphate acyltransferase